VGGADFGASGAAVDPVGGPEAGSAAAFARQRATADRVFRGCVAVAAALSAVTLWAAVRGGNHPILGNVQLGLEALGRVAVGITIVGVLWGWLWYGIRVLLLAKVVGLSKDERRAVFRSRMDGSFDLGGLLARHSERRIRIVDMIGRRGRFITVGSLGFSYVYARIREQPTPAFLYSGLQESLLDAVLFSWVMIAAYYTSGFLGRVLYGAQMRIMDGTLARANCLLITTLWSIARFLVVPVGTALAVLFPPETYAALFAFVWLSYMAGDTASEVIGSLFGKQKLRVWGIGEVNRKSVAGTWACFLASFALCAGIATAQGLPASWFGLALAIAVSNTVFELFSPRGTDDVTMVAASGLICWAFGAFTL
jgi:dolichol kinase